MNELTLEPIAHINGSMQLPGSKSLTNRALLLAALANGTTRVHNVLRSDDTTHMVNALRQLAVPLAFSEDGLTCEVKGMGGLFGSPNETRFFLGNAGTAIRPLTAMLSLVQGEFTIDGDEYMRERPIGHLVDALIQLGATVRYLGKPGYPPLQLRGGTIRGGACRVPGNISSQYLTSLLLAVPLAERDSEVEVVGEQVSKPYLDITLDIMAKFGVTASHEHYQRFHIPGQQSYQSPGDYLVEGDASSASYFFAAGAIKGGAVTVNGIGRNSVQGDIGFLDALEAMGAIVERDEHSITVRRGTLRGIDMDLNHIPDAAMTIAVVALFAEGTTTIRNVYNWRVKETDRMHAMAQGLRALGASVTTTDDSITIDPPETLQPARIETFSDHRIAMCFSLAALGGVAVTFDDGDCTAKTFPGYFPVLQSLAEQVT